jgi:ribosomal protein S18 acetylase RimI-like enzyme
MIAHRGLALRPSPMLRHQKNGRYALREAVALTDWGLPAPGFKKAAVLGPSPPLERVREMAAEFFGGNDYGILVEADAGHPVEAELRAAAWAVSEDEPALVMPALPEPPPPELAIRRVTDEAGRRNLLAVMAAGFGAPTADLGEPLSAETMDTFGPSLACALDPDVALLVGYAGGRPVSSAVLHRVEDIACITGVATVPDCRRRGFARALTWAAIRAGADRGCACATLNALGASYALYLGMGFRHVCNHRTYVPPK